MPQSLSWMPTHLIFSTKNREPLIADSIREALHAYMAAILKKHDCQPILINSVEDQIHLLFSLGRTIAVADAVKHVKASSSKWIKSEGSQFKWFSWQTGYCAVGVSESKVKTVSHYIARQKEHHHRKTFQSEYLSLLGKHGIKYDERYVWD